MKNLFILISKIPSKVSFLLYLGFTLLGFLGLLFAFWLSGASALPFGDGSFNADARQIKPWIILDKKPSSVLISNSRAVYGFDPSEINADNLYNASLTGIGLNEIIRVLKHSYYAGAGKKHFYIGIDNICESFTNDLDSTFFDSDYLLSEFDSIDNFKRVRAIMGAPIDILRRTAFHTPGTNKHGFRLFFPDKNYHNGGVKLSLLKREEMDYRNISFSRNCDVSSYVALLDFIYEKGLNATLFMNPKHVRNYIAYDILGDLNSYLWMVRQADIINANTAQAHSKNSKPICYFNYINEFTTEPFDKAQTEHDPMTYWYENSHFKTSLGSIVLDSMITVGELCNSKFDEELFLESYNNFILVNKHEYIQIQKFLHNF